MTLLLVRDRYRTSAEAEIATAAAEARRRTLPPAARAYVALVLVAALGCVLPLLGEVRTGQQWSRTAVLALLFALCDRLGSRAGGAADQAPGAGVAHFPVLLAGVILLPPAAAALVALPGALLAPALPPRTVRRAWNAAQLGLSCFLAGSLFHGLHGHRLLTEHRLPGLLLPVLLAALTFCLANGLLMVGVLVTAEPGEHPGLWQAMLLRCPASVFGNGLLGLMTALLWEGPYGALAAVPALLPLGLSSWVSAQARREQTAHRAAVRALVQAVEIKDSYTRGHSERVGRAAVLMARELRMAERRVASLRVAGTLHDVGKLGVPTRLLRKSGPLTDEEYREVVQHPEYGHELVRGIGFLGEARAGILHHHERMDGRGYPHGLAGQAIPEFARVIAVADAFDSMTSTRSYRRGRPVQEAVAELERCAGSQFDPVMVTALARAVRRHGWQPAPVGRADEQAPDIPLGVREPLRRLPAPAGPAGAGTGAAEQR
ncbi:HD-GYP domain-containing protein [Streptacidiphilus sp. N1-12]|uniref:HD-GYP domain-containing protein n=2 Tax=Streptacidiphilus alkalitolerans TaxID=3342712 RepID=A0ABV6WK53_9ACTN